jgi:SprT protein
MKYQNVQTTNDKKDILREFIPEGALDLFLALQEEHHFNLKVSQKRLTKLGDFRPARAKYENARISVNHDLNPYDFLLTLIHEIAHVITWNQYQNKVKPHGGEWKQNYRDLIARFNGLNVFPTEISEYLNQNDIAFATSKSEIELKKLLGKYDDKPGVLYLEDIEEGQIFSLTNGRMFKKGKKRRKSFICDELETNKKYVIHPMAEIKPISGQN